MSATKNKKADILLKKERKIQFMMTADEMLLKGYSFEKMRLYFYMMKEAGVAKAEPEFYHREYNRMRYLAIKKNKKKWIF